MTNEDAIEILEMLKIRPRRGSSMIIAQTAVNVALQTGINALYEKKDRIEKADNDLSSELEKNSKKLENRLKSDMVAMLTDIQLDIEEHNMTSGVINQDTWNECIACCSRVIQQKIDALKVVDDGNDGR